MADLSRRALLRRLLPGAPQPAPPRFVVRVVSERCIVFRGPECGACVGLCPDEIPALALRRARPRFVVESCSGCGRCVEACPIIPAALEVDRHEPPRQAKEA